jgi:autotransporter strand-loop-strand O-heptosyltransferase
MKIAQVNLGLLPIPPNGWGAVEKIIWNYYLELRELGHEVSIPYINEIERDVFDIVHVHAWNHAFEMKSKGIPYIFTCHDHHAFIYGKNSVVYKNNLQAMKWAKLSIVPAKYLVEYFENVPVYLQHGVSREEFSLNTPNIEKKLLCVGNNGLIEEKTFDRKGFRFAIESAKNLGIPITVVGPTNVNKQFFEENKELLGQGVNVVYDLNEKELQDVYKTHDILVHATSIEAGHPPLTILEAASAGLPVITTDCAGNLHTVRIERNVESVMNGIKYVLENYDNVRDETLTSVKEYEWKSVVNLLNNFYVNNITMNMRKSALKVYNKVKKTHTPNRLEFHFIDGAFVEILGNDDRKYNVEFIDSKTKETVFQTNMSNNNWSRTDRKWFTDWLIKVTSNTGEVFTHKFDPKNKRVFIAFESSSLGDTLAWIPYVEEFRKKHNCHVIVSTFLNHLFETEYPNIEFVKPGTTVHNLYALYRLGVFLQDNQYDRFMHKNDYKKLRLQEVASDILGLDFEEIRPRMKSIEIMKSDKPYICIGNHSTAQSKYWNNSTGWQELVDYVKELGYDVYLLSKEEDGYMGNKNPTGVIKVDGKTLEEISSILLGSKGFVGISSGLSWLAWTLKVPTILISGCTEEVHEPLNGVRRIINTNVCNSCFSSHTFDKGDWNWCPLHKGTERQFECSKEITFSMVKPKIDKILQS